MYTLPSDGSRSARSRLVPDLRGVDNLGAPLAVLSLEREEHMSLSAGRFASPQPGSFHLAQQILIVVLGWPLALWSAWRADRRLRSYGPPLVLALRPSRPRQS